MAGLEPTASQLLFPQARPDPWCCSKVPAISVPARHATKFLKIPATMKIFTTFGSPTPAGQVSLSSRAQGTLPSASGDQGEEPPQLLKSILHGVRQVSNETPRPRQPERQPSGNHWTVESWVLNGWECAVSA